MAKDLELIKRLEKKYGTKLFEIGIGDIENFLSDNIGYAVDENENIIGLRLNLLDISDISEIQYLTALRALDLSQNQISDISPVLKLKNLELLVLFDNRISHLPEELLNLGLEIEWEISENDNIFLEGNPLEIPPVEIVKQGNEAIRAYFESLKGEKQALNEVKVLLIGDGGAGKTSLMKRLLAEGFNKNEPQTHGINIKSWKINVDETQIKVNFWDFGGQEIMHATTNSSYPNESSISWCWTAEKMKKPNTGSNILKVLVAIHRCWWCSTKSMKILTLMLIGLSCKINTIISKDFTGSPVLKIQV